MSELKLTLMVHVDLLLVDGVDAAAYETRMKEALLADLNAMAPQLASDAIISIDGWDELTCWSASASGFEPSMLMMQSSPIDGMKPNGG